MRRLSFGLCIEIGEIGTWCRTDGIYGFIGQFDFLAGTKRRQAIREKEVFVTAAKVDLVIIRAAIISQLFNSFLSSCQLP